MKKNENLKNLSIVLIILALIALSFGLYKNVKYYDRIQERQIKLEKRVETLQQALQTKDKEIEAGLTNTQKGLMLKIEYIENQIGAGK
mgnify:CR=1 FL=1